MIGSIETGVAAAKMIAGLRKGPEDQIVVYEKSAWYSCGSYGLPHYLTESLESIKDAIEAKKTLLAEDGIEAHLLHEVISVDPAQREITVKDLSGNRTFRDRYDRLILSTGSAPKVPQVPGAERLGVHTLGNVSDLIFLKEFIRTPYVRDICVLGSGTSALEIVKAFVKLNRSVRVIAKEEKLLPGFDPEVSDLIRAELEKEGVAFSLGQSVTAFEGRTFIERVKTSKGSFDCDLCICAEGSVPDAALAKTAGLLTDERGAVLIDGSLRTSEEGIYAAGSCAVRTDGTLGTTSVSVAGLEIAKTGLTETQARQASLSVKSVIAEGNDRPGITPDPVTITIKLVFDPAGGRIYGAQAWGAQNAAARINAIAVAVEAGMTVSRLADVDFVYASSASSAWDPVRIACSAAMNLK